MLLPSMGMPGDISACCFFQVCQQIHCRATGIASWSSSESKYPGPGCWLSLLPAMLQCVPRAERCWSPCAKAQQMSDGYGGRTGVGLALASEIQPALTSRLSLELTPGQPLHLANPQLLNYQITALLILMRCSAADGMSDDLKPSNPLIAVLNAICSCRAEMKVWARAEKPSRGCCW